MVKEHEQHREADLIVLLDLYATKEFSEPLQERAISLAATICVEQTRQSSSGRYRLMIAGKDLQNVECMGSGGFRDAALKELALCESSPKAQLASMLLAVCRGQLAPNSRFVLITPRPQAARLLADSIAQENLRHEQQFTGRLMIVAADEATLNVTLALDVDPVPVLQQRTVAEKSHPLSETHTSPIQSSMSARPAVAAPVLDAGDRNLQSVFFRSVTLTTALAGLVLCHSEGSFLPAILTPIVAVVAWIFVDHWKWIRLPTWTTNACGLAALAMSIYEFSRGTVEGKLLSGSHMLVYLTCIVLMMPKGHRQYWWLMALTLLQMAVAAVLKTGVFFGGSMLMMMALLLWTLSVFSLYRVMDLHVSRTAKRDATGSRGDHEPPSILKSSKVNGRISSIQVRDGLQRDTSETWVGWRFRSMVSGSFVVSLMLAVFVFAAFPRVWVQGSGTFAADAASSGGLGSRSGFNDTVTLGRVGPISLSQQRVLLFSVTSLKTLKSVSAERLAEAIDMDEIRFRGSSMGHYRDGRWTAGFQERGFDIPGFSKNEFTTSGDSDAEFRVEITQDPPIGEFVFAPFPAIDVKTMGNVSIQQRAVSGSFLWSGAPTSSQPRSYTVECPRVEAMSHPGIAFEYWAIPHQSPANTIDDMRRTALRVARRFYVPASIAENLPRLHRLTNEICTRDGQLIPEADRVRGVMQYLSAENGFAYSTTQTRSDQSIDPVEDFLFNTKSGHCEYYASACVLMLQSVQLPARLVNGYYGSDVNSMTGNNEVRQRHAHSWVEVFLDSRWQTLEPTPAVPRREMVSAGQSDSLISSLQTAISDIWNDGVHNMSAERQKQFFAPVISTSKSMLDTIRQQGFLRAVWSGIQSFLMSPESWFSWRGGVATFLLLLIAGLISRLHPITRMLRTLRSVLARFSQQQRARRSVIRFYAKFCAVCEQHGMRLKSANSALENGHLALERFGERLDSDYLRQLPIHIATAFNAVRFGQAELTDEQTASIGKDLTDFANALSNRHSVIR